MLLVVTYFSFFILLICAPSLLFLMNLAKHLSFVYFFKDQRLVSLNFSSVFLSLSHLFYWHYYFFPSNLEGFGFKKPEQRFWILFVPLFLILQVWNLGCLFEILLVSWCRLEWLWTPLLKLLLLHPIDCGSLCFHLHVSPGMYVFP